MNILNIFSPKKPKESLQEFKKIRKLTQKQLAVLLGISQTYISLYFSGKRTFGAKTAIRISQKTGIPIENLIQ